MKAYIVVEADSPKELQGAVNTWLEEGWKPQGGMTVAAVAGQGSFSGNLVSVWKYYQAVLKEES